jgi:hypothetical protein
MNNTLLKITVGEKNGKKWYLANILVYGEIIKTFIYENQYNNIVSQLTDAEKARIIVIKK